MRRRGTSEEFPTWGEGSPGATEGLQVTPKLHELNSCLKKFCFEYVNIILSQIPKHAEKSTVTMGEKELKSAFFWNKECLCLQSVSVLNEQVQFF